MVTRLGLGVIDKLDLRIRSGSVLRPAVREYTRGLPYETYTARVRPAVHYTGNADLRSVGIDAILHVQCKHGDKHHKLEVLDAGKKPYSEIVGLVAIGDRSGPGEYGNHANRFDCRRGGGNRTVAQISRPIQIQTNRKRARPDSIRLDRAGGSRNDSCREPTERLSHLQQD